MNKIASWFLFYASVACILLSVLWFVGVFWYLSVMEGTYGYVTEDGSEVCGIPIFTDENWIWMSFQLFGVPVLILLAAVRTIHVSRKLTKVNQ